MKVHIVRTPADQWTTDVLERNERLRHTISADSQGWEAMRRPENCDIGTFDAADATHLLVIDGDELVGSSRRTPLDEPSLLQTVFSGLMHDDLPASPSHGADWTRFCARLDRREGWRRAPESAALFCATKRALGDARRAMGTSNPLPAGPVRRLPAPIDLPLLH